MANIGTHLGPWFDPYVVKGESLAEYRPQVLTDVVAAGLASVEPVVATESEVATLAALCSQRGLQVASVFVPIPLNGVDWEPAANTVLELATLAKSAMGCGLVTVSPACGDGRDSDGKSDEQIIHQAEALRWLAGRLDRRGVQLAYHASPEAMQFGAREFHHMMAATRNMAMKLCLDVEAIYRGCGGSRIAVQNIITLYGDRIGSVHVRQSSGGTLTEYLVEGDVDYAAVFRQLQRFDFSGPVYLATGRGEGTPKTVTLIESHRRSLRYLQQVMKVKA